MARALCGPALAVVAIVAAGILAAGAGSTDIRRVDEFIDAPRTLFGDSITEIVRTLGPPIRQDSLTRRSDVDRVARRVLQRLTYQGLTLETHTRLVRVALEDAGRGLPFAIDIGVARAAVEAALGEPTEAGDDHALYLYSDGFPKTVTFHFREGRVARITWEYWID